VQNLTLRKYLHPSHLVMNFLRTGAAVGPVTGCLKDFIPAQIGIYPRYLPGLYFCGDLV